MPTVLLDEEPNLDDVTLLVTERYRLNGRDLYPTYEIKPPKEALKVYEDTENNQYILNIDGDQIQLNTGAEEILIYPKIRKD